MEFFRSIFITSLLIVIATTASADLPLSVEGIITEEGSIKLDSSLSYSNSDHQRLMTGDPIVIQTGPSSFISLPTKISESKTNTDVVVTTLGLRYGLTPDAEIYTRASYLYRSTRFNDLAQMNSDNEKRFVDSWLGLNYQFLQDSATPALLGFIEGALYEKHQQSHSSGKSWTVGMTAFRAIDPVVLSLTTAFQWNQKRKDGDARFQPGSYYF